jgi:hypothetical protein
MIGNGFELTIILLINCQCPTIALRADHLAFVMDDEGNIALNLIDFNEREFILFVCPECEF